jgi:hypothetical protein
MPRYFFHISFSDRVSFDEEGVELRDQAAAREEASAVIRELSDPALKGNPRRWAGWFLLVTDEGGPFFRAPIGYPALELVTQEWQPRRERPKVKETRLLPEIAAAQFGKRERERLVRQISARRADTAALMEKTRKLLEEVLRVWLTSKEMHALSKVLIQRAKGMRGFGDYSSAPKASRSVEGGNLSERKEPRG